MTVEELIAELSTKCFFEIRNSFTGFYMVPELRVYYVEAEVRLDKKNFYTTFSRGHHLQTCLMSVRKDVIEYYQKHFPEYL